MIRGQSHTSGASSSPAEGSWKREKISSNQTLTYPIFASEERDELDTTSTGPQTRSIHLAGRPTHCGSHPSVLGCAADETHQLGLFKPPDQHAKHRRRRWPSIVHPSPSRAFFSFCFSGPIRLIRYPSRSDVFEIGRPRCSHLAPALCIFPSINLSCVAGLFQRGKAPRSATRDRSSRRFSCHTRIFKDPPPAKSRSLLPTPQDLLAHPAPLVDNMPAIGRRYQRQQCHDGAVPASR